MIQPFWGKVYPTYWLEEAKYYARLLKAYPFSSGLEMRLWECLFNHYWEEDDE